MNPAAVKAGIAKNPQVIEFSPKVTVTTAKESVVVNGKKQSYKAVDAAVSVPLTTLHPGTQLKGDATLSVREYADSKHNFHRVVTPKHIRFSSKAFEPLFDILAHAILVRNAKAQNKSENVQVAFPQNVELKDKEFEVQKPKAGKNGIVSVVALSKINSQLKVAVSQNSKGVSDITLSQKTLTAIVKDQKAGKKESYATIVALQKKALASIEKYKTDHAGKKIDKKIDHKHDHKKHDHKHHKKH